MLRVTVLSLLFASVAGGAVELTSANFDAEVTGSGKSAFVKFLAPWCVPRLAFCLDGLVLDWWLWIFDKFRFCMPVVTVHLDLPATGEATARR